MVRINRARNWSRSGTLGFGSVKGCVPTVVVVAATATTTNEAD
jgi:hypothetical protein